MIQLRFFISFGHKKGKSYRYTGIRKYYRNEVTHWWNNVITLLFLISTFSVEMLFRNTFKQIFQAQCPSTPVPPPCLLHSFLLSPIQKYPDSSLIISITREGSEGRWYFDDVNLPRTASRIEHRISYMKTIGFTTLSRNHSPQ